MPPRATIDAPRMHLAWFPDRLQIEPALAKDHADAINTLKGMGHTIDPPKGQGDAHSIFYDATAKAWIGIADRRRSGSAAGYR